MMIEDHKMLHRRDGIIVKPFTGFLRARCEIRERALEHRTRTVNDAFPKNKVD